MKKVVVTGCAGMIGSHLIDELIVNENILIVGIDNLSFGKVENLSNVINHERLKFYRADVRDIEALKILCCDADLIIHLAAVKKIGEMQKGMDTLKVNTQGTENVLEVAKMWGCKVVLASTSDVYGMAPVPHSEDGDLLLGPSMIKRWAYAVSKLYDEQLAFAYYKDEGVPIVVLRYFGGFSARSSFSWSGGHIPIFINSILKGETVKVHGDGSQTRSMSYVTDLVRGTIAAAFEEKAVGEIINLGNDKEVSVIDSVYMINDVIKEITGVVHEPKVEFVPFSDIFGKYKDIMRRCPDLSKAKKILNYKPEVELRDGIVEAVKTCYKLIH